jgi:hypothetical protein
MKRALLAALPTITEREKRVPHSSPSPTCQQVLFFQGQVAKIMTSACVLQAGEGEKCGVRFPSSVRVGKSGKYAIFILNYSIRVARRVKIFADSFAGHRFLPNNDVFVFSYICVFTTPLRKMTSLVKRTNFGSIFFTTTWIWLYIIVWRIFFHNSLFFKEVHDIAGDARKLQMSYLGLWPIKSQDERSCKKSKRQTTSFLNCIFQETVT